MYPVRTVDFDRLWCKNFELHHFEVLHHCNAYITFLNLY
jgi:hypothetical protein